MAKKKGRESNWQFDSRSLKVGNRPNFLACRWCAKWCWKALNEGYDFALNLISIGGLHTKLWDPKVAGVPTLGISGFPFGSPGTKCHLDVGLVKRHRIYYKGEGGGFPQVRVVVNLVSPNCSWFVLTPKVLQLCINHLMFDFVQVHVSSWCLSFFLVPSWNSSTPFYPQSAANQGACPDSLLFHCFQFILTFESIKELGSTSFALRPFCALQNFHVLL
jgi:hypothetical protein